MSTPDLKRKSQKGQLASVKRLLLLPYRETSWAVSFEKIEEVLALYVKQVRRNNSRLDQAVRVFFRCAQLCKIAGQCVTRELADPRRQGDQMARKPLEPVQYMVTDI